MVINRLSKSLLVAIIISIQDPALRIAAVCKVTRLFKKRLLTVTLLYKKFKSMFILFIKNNKRMCFNIRVVFDLLGCFVSSNKIIKGTKWDFITRTVYQNKKSLFGIDKFDKSNLGSEWVSHVFEMQRVQLQKNGNIYLPITDKIITKFRNGYEGKLYDGLVFDTLSNSVVSKVEFKSKVRQYFNESLLNKFLKDYGSIGVDRLDLCCLNSQSFKETVLNVNKLDHHLFSLKLNPVDFSTVFIESNNDFYSNNINKIISNQMVLKSDLMDAWFYLLSDSSFFPVN